MTPTCETCKFWRRSPDVFGFGDPRHGDCLRHAPVQAEDVTYMAVWPKSYEYAWCGDHAEREEG